MNFLIVIPVIFNAKRMKKTLLFILIHLTVLSSYGQDNSPEVVSTAGNSFEGENIRLDWTLGEIAVTTIKNSGRQITQVFHQPAYLITRVKDFPVDEGQVKVSPNPVQDRLEIQVTLKQNRPVTIQLFDTEGKVIWTKKYQGRELEESVYLGPLPDGNCWRMTLDNKVTG
jgi:hypothetical protein